jgi:hypothetical protein
MESQTEQSNPKSNPGTDSFVFYGVAPKFNALLAVGVAFGLDYLPFVVAGSW